MTANGLKELIILPCRAENINQFTIGNGSAAVPYVGGYDRKQAGLQYLGYIVNDKLELPFNCKRELLINVPVTMDRTARLYVDKIYRIGVGVD